MNYTKQTAPRATKGRQTRAKTPAASQPSRNQPIMQRHFQPRGHQLYRRDKEPECGRRHQAQKARIQAKPCHGERAYRHLFNLKQLQPNTSKNLQHHVSPSQRDSDTPTTQEPVHAGARMTLANNICPGDSQNQIEYPKAVLIRAGARIKQNPCISKPASSQGRTTQHKGQLFMQAETAQPCKGKNQPVMPSHKTNF